jgi:hypothetical protein
VVYIMVSSPPATEETGSMVNEIRVIAFRVEKVRVVCMYMPDFQLEQLLSGLEVVAESVDVLDLVVLVELLVHDRLEPILLRRLAAEVPDA